MKKIDSVNFVIVVANFVAKFTVFTWEDSGHISCRFHCNMWLHSKTLWLFEVKCTLFIVSRLLTCSS